MRSLLLLRRLRTLSRLTASAVRNPIAFLRFAAQFPDPRRAGLVPARFSGGLPTVSIREVLPRLDDVVEPYSFLGGGSGLTDLILLKGLARSYPECSYLEIGLWRGESIANVASIAKKCVGVSLSRDDLESRGWSSGHLGTRGIYSEDLANVTIIGADSLTYDFEDYYGDVDLVYVDGDHSFEAVAHDTRTAFKLLRNESSVIVWHDYLRRKEREVYWPVLAGILAGTPPELRGHLKHVSHTLCAMYSRKEYAEIPWAYPVIPKTVFSAHITATEFPRS